MQDLQALAREAGQERPNVDRDRPGEWYVQKKVFQATVSHLNTAVKDWYPRSARQRQARHCAPLSLLLLILDAMHR